MKLDGKFRIAAPRSEVFARLNDPYFFASCLEGVSDLKEIDEDNYTATLETKVAYINFRFDVAVSLTERTAERVTVKLEGAPRGMVGRLSSVAVANLVEVEDGHETEVAYEMDLALAGRLGSLGQPVMKAKAKDMERGFVRKASQAFVSSPTAGGIEKNEVAALVQQSPAPDRNQGGPGLRARIADLAQALATRLRGPVAIAEVGRDIALAGIPAHVVEAVNADPAVVHGSAVRTRLHFDLLRPTSLAEAVALLDSEDPLVRPISGGTAIMLMMKTGVFRPTTLVDLSGIGSELATIATDLSGGVRIGGLVSLADLGRSADVARLAPVITETMPRISNVRVRNAARVGGCLAHGDPHMDLPPILASLRAYVDITGPGGTRSLPVEELYAGYYQTVLSRGEIITAVRLPEPGRWRSVYRKTTVRTHEDWPALGVAISLLTDGLQVREARVVISAATERVTRVLELEEKLTGSILCDEVGRSAGALAASAVQTVDDVQGSSAYKSQLIRVEVQRALASIAESVAA